MKKLWTLSLVVCFALPGMAQQPAGPTPRQHSVILEAQSVANGGKATMNAGSRTDSYVSNLVGGPAAQVNELTMHDQQRTGNAAHVQVNIRNLGAKPDHLQLQWYFFANPVGITARQPGGGKEFVFDQGRQEVDLQPGANAPILVASKEIQSEINRTSTVISGADGSTSATYAGGLSAVSTSVERGSKMKGWCVRLVDGDRIAAVAGSSDSYQEIAKDDARLKAMGGK